MPAPDRPSTDHPPRLDSLTGLRALAAGTVFVYHLHTLGVFTGTGQSVLTAIAGGGASAVSLFFILSGFVLAWSHRPGTPTRVIWWNRLVRIWPLHLVAFALALLVAATVYPAIRTVDPLAALANLFLVSAWRADWWQAGNPVSWSLVCEAFFYLLFPIIMRFLLRLPRASVFGVTAVAIALIWILPAMIPVVAPELSAYSNPVLRMPEFVLGLALAVLMREHGWRGPRLSIVIPIALAGYVAATVEAGSPFGAAAWTAVGFGLLIAALARADQEARNTWLARRAAVFLGDRSFAFYLVHLLALQVFVGLQPQLPSTISGNPYIAAVVAGTAAFLLACVMHRAVERPVVDAFRLATS
ncbi:Peptidoglycan/LPS O-acetylase OafA/YrhL, contains acyltransferase and SGNH-hydrolase domains [Plantibacter flavus]|uniref:Peptidoglycan/LPS O-acetylase OafA/YrhL n=1 Tax=Plantibacter flavus TaxID=150123 RepID=A0A3N2C2C9_9MICO|nr:acyltransferase [Plantibacter flavus]ROR81666.1 peptidoglycan/LPS O-acetylase OafA/YrhL [Plantibacter flavus]SMG15390.1 Peptidoglycan/LPS O-acetylase OafA/YrhL, contains acyltransferase and SGNH-hydrolase domains [Plantibacter flavus]